MNKIEKYNLYQDIKSKIVFPSDSQNQVTVIYDDEVFCAFCEEPLKPQYNSEKNLWITECSKCKENPLQKEYKESVMATFLANIRLMKIEEKIQEKALEVYKQKHREAIPKRNSYLMHIDEAINEMTVDNLTNNEQGGAD